MHHHFLQVVDSPHDFHNFLTFLFACIAKNLVVFTYIATEHTITTLHCMPCHTMCHSICHAHAMLYTCAMSYHMLWMSYHVIPYAPISYHAHVKPCHAIYHTICNLSCYMTLHVISCHIICYVMSCYAICHAISWHGHVMPWHDTCHVMSYHKPWHMSCHI